MCRRNSLRSRGQTWELCQHLHCGRQPADISHIGTFLSLRSEGGTGDKLELLNLFSPQNTVFRVDLTRRCFLSSLSEFVLLLFTKLRCVCFVLLILWLVAGSVMQHCILVMVRWWMGHRMSFLITSTLLTDPNTALCLCCRLGHTFTLATWFWILEVWIGTWSQDHMVHWRHILGYRWSKWAGGEI